MKYCFLLFSDWPCVPWDKSVDKYVMSCKCQLGLPPEMHEEMRSSQTSTKQCRSTGQVEMGGDSQTLAQKH